MRTNSFCTKFLNTPRGPGHPSKIPGTSQSPPFEAQGRLETLTAWLVQTPTSRISPKSIGEGASSLFGEWPRNRENVSCSSATPDLHRCNLGVALEQETFSGLPSPPPKRLLARSPIDLGAIREFGACTRQSGSQRKTNLRGRARTFRPPPLCVEDPHPTGRSPDPKSSSSFFVPDQRAPKPPTFAQPGLSSSNGSHPQREATNFSAFVPIRLVLPRREATNLGVFDLVAHHCCDHCRATQCRAHSVAANSCNFRDVAGVLSYTRHTPEKKTLSHLSCHPSVTVSQEKFLAKTDRATRGCSSYTHTNRATLCH